MTVRLQAKRAFGFSRNGCSLSPKYTVAQTGHRSNAGLGRGQMMVCSRASSLAICTASIRMTVWPARQFDFALGCCTSYRRTLRAPALPTAEISRMRRGRPPTRAGSHHQLRNFRVSEYRVVIANCRLTTRRPAASDQPAKRRARLRPSVQTSTVAGASCTGYGNVLSKILPMRHASNANGPRLGYWSSPPPIVQPPGQATASHPTNVGRQANECAPQLRDDGLTPQRQ